MKEYIGLIVLLVLAINCITCTIARGVQAGKMDISQIQTEKNKIFLLAGSTNQASVAFENIIFPEEYEKVYLDYSLFGFDLQNTVSQLNQVAKKDDLMVGISIGAKPIVCSEIEGKKILINPCTEPSVLQPTFKNLTYWLSPLAEIICYALGWIAVLPIIPAEGGKHYSLALMVDQFYWMGRYTPTTYNIDGKTGVVVSTQDEFLQNDEIRKVFEKCHFVEIDTMHGRTNDPAVAGEHNRAVQTLLE